MKTKSECPHTYVRECRELIAKVAKDIVSYAPEAINITKGYLETYTGTQRITRISQSRPEGDTVNALTTQVMEQLVNLEELYRNLNQYIQDTESIEREDVPSNLNLLMSALVYHHMSQGASGSDCADLMNVLGAYRFMNDQARSALVPRLNLLGIGIHKHVHISLNTPKTFYMFYVVSKGKPEW